MRRQVIIHFHSHSHFYSENFASSGGFISPPARRDRRGVQTSASAVWTGWLIRSVSVTRSLSRSDFRSLSVSSSSFLYSP